MLCALLDTPACGISRDEEMLSFVDLSVLRGLGRSRVALDDHLLMSMEAYEAKIMLLDVEAKLAQCSDEFCAGRVMDARKSLQKLRKKHGL